MELTTIEMNRMRAILMGEPLATQPVDGDERSRYHVGAIWYGDWRRPDAGSGFGSQARACHNACVGRRNRRLTFFTLHPVTSKQHHARGAVQLPRGMIPGGKFTESWVLTHYKLLASRQALDERFEYRCNLPEEWVAKLHQRGGK